MMSHLKFLFSICIICGLAACSKAPALTETEVLETIEAYDAAWNRKDTTAVVQLLTDNYVYFGSEGKTRTRQWLLDLLINPAYHLDHAERSEVRVVIYGNTAIVSSRWQGTGSWEEEPVRDDQRCSLTLVKQNDQLQIISEHCTQIEGL